MEIDYEKTVRYINTDLVLTAPVDLTSLAEVISPESESPDTATITRLHVGYIDGIGYQATFEAFDQYGNFKTPEESINCLLNCIEQLPVALQSLWRACSKKTESHRVSRRLQFLREWRHEEINSLFPRSP